MNEQYRDAIRASNHTIKSKLLAVSGFSELLTQDNADQKIKDMVQVIRNAIQDISNSSTEISLQLKASEEAHVARNIAGLKSSVNQCLRPAVERLIEAVEENESSRQYKQKISMALQQLESVIADMQ